VVKARLIGGFATGANFSERNVDYQTQYKPTKAACEQFVKAVEMTN
jgi:hypothetical protein